MSTFAKEVQTYAGVFDSPLYGWISGVDVSEIGKRSPKTFAGEGTPRDDRASALHVTLPPGKAAKIDIINLFFQGQGAEIEFADRRFRVDRRLPDRRQVGEPRVLRRQEQDRRQVAAGRELSGRDGERIAARSRSRGGQDDVLRAGVQGR